jgi:ABC-2 type transport system ATP-binding protein
MEEMKKQLRPTRLIQARVLNGELQPLQEMLLHADKVGETVTSADVELPLDTLRFDFSGDDQELSDLLSNLIGQGIPIVSFNEVTGDLEDVFLQVTRGIVN